MTVLMRTLRESPGVSAQQIDGRTTSVSRFWGAVFDPPPKRDIPKSEPYARSANNIRIALSPHRSIQYHCFARTDHRFVEIFLQIGGIRHCIDYGADCIYIYLGHDSI